MSPSPAQGPRGVLPDPLRRALLLKMGEDFSVPLLTEGAVKVLAICRDPDADLRELARLVKQEPSLAAHVLQLANSAAHAGRVPVQSLGQAIHRLGLSTVRDLAIAVALKERVFCLSGYPARLRELWTHSAVAACYAKGIALLLGRDADCAFLCGLLHDVGMAVAMHAVCALVQERVVPPVESDVIEAAMREFHCQLGAKLAECWHLGPAIGPVILFHDDPANAPVPRDDVLVTALADALAYWTVDEARTEADFAADDLTQELGLSSGELALLLRERTRVVKAARALL